MNKILLTGGFAALILAAAGGAALAQSSAEPSQARGLRADTDGDQRLSQAEFVGRRVTRLTAADADRDGSVTADERRAAAETRRAGGYITVAERRDSRAERRQQRHERRAERRAARQAQQASPPAPASE